MQIWFRGCAVFATLKIPSLFRKTTSVLVHSLLFLSETLRPCLEQVHMELYTLLMDKNMCSV